MQKKTKTLKQYVAFVGSQEKAAAVIGVSFCTLNRWINRHTRPRGLALKRVRDLGIRF